MSTMLIVYTILSYAALIAAIRLGLTAGNPNDRQDQLFIGAAVIVAPLTILAIVCILLVLGFLMLMDVCNCRIHQRAAKWLLGGTVNCVAGFGRWLLTPWSSTRTPVVDQNWYLQHPDGTVDSVPVDMSTPTEEPTTK